MLLHRSVVVRPPGAVTPVCGCEASRCCYTGAQRKQYELVESEVEIEDQLQTDAASGPDPEIEGSHTRVRRGGEGRGGEGRGRDGRGRDGTGRDGRGRGGREGERSRREVQGGSRDGSGGSVCVQEGGAGTQAPALLGVGDGGPRQT